MELSGVADLVRPLRVGNFLTDAVRRRSRLPSDGRSTPPTPSERGPESSRRRSCSSWSGAHRLVEWFYRHRLRWVFIPWVGPSLLLAAAGGFLAFWSSYQDGTFSISSGSACRESLVLLAMSYFLTFMHELGHAVVLVHYGRRVKSAGFMIYFGSPAFFVESSDGLMMDRGQADRAVVRGAVRGARHRRCARRRCWAFPDWSLSPTFYKFALLNYFVIFLNLVPLARARRVLHPRGPDPGPRPAPTVAAVHPLRPLAASSGGGSGSRSRRSGSACTRSSGSRSRSSPSTGRSTSGKTIFGGLVDATCGTVGSPARVLLVALALFIDRPADPRR